ncbi:hypothetical protein Cgig2_012140 [Carnegiea gigantea]|uniref:Uncharacterized protein n=1 Tax=Carnegiea gigantea TaxID=171969 RepID=A0A9Q1KPP5_9CARY|nr:hypothetical protein Cgig2_012140 [Carnegiea gigantea]
MDCNGSWPSNFGSDPYVSLWLISKGQLHSRALERAEAGRNSTGQPVGTEVKPSDFSQARKRSRNWAGQPVPGQVERFNACGGNRTGHDVPREVERNEPLKPAERLGYGAGEPAVELKGLEVGEIGNGARDGLGEIAVYMERLEERKSQQSGVAFGSQSEKARLVGLSLVLISRSTFFSFGLHCAAEEMEKRKKSSKKSRENVQEVHLGLAERSRDWSTQLVARQEQDHLWVLEGAKAGRDRTGDTITTEVQLADVSPTRKRSRNRAGQKVAGKVEIVQPREPTKALGDWTGELVIVKGKISESGESAQCRGDRTGEAVGREVKRSELGEAAEKVWDWTTEPHVELKALEVDEVDNGVRDCACQVSVYMECLEER